MGQAAANGTGWEFHSLVHTSSKKKLLEANTMDEQKLIFLLSFLVNCCIRLHFLESLRKIFFPHLSVTNIAKLSCYSN